MANLTADVATALLNCFASGRDDDGDNDGDNNDDNDKEKDEAKDEAPAHGAHSTHTASIFHF